ncbi:MAG TPA: hypothetical protein PLG04_02305 [Anaerolineaceae bacterium]|nr:hypothetical protein [Anaerolineaceae bacterium]
MAILEAILEVLKEKPFYGYRRIAREVGYMGVTRKQIVNADLHLPVFA